MVHLVEEDDDDERQWQRQQQHSVALICSRSGENKEGQAGRLVESHGTSTGSGAPPAPVDWLLPVAGPLPTGGSCPPAPVRRPESDRIASRQGAVRVGPGTVVRRHQRSGGSHLAVVGDVSSRHTRGGATSRLRRLVDGTGCFCGTSGSAETWESSSSNGDQRPHAWMHDHRRSVLFLVIPAAIHLVHLLVDGCNLTRQFIISGSPPLVHSRLFGGKHKAMSTEGLDSCGGGAAEG
jgi:hypothetical protein